MNTAMLPTRESFAFATHLLGGIVYIIVVLRGLMTPVDLFIHHTWFLDRLLQNLVIGLTFYGFSLACLYLRPLSPGWGVTYASVSWLFLCILLLPAHPDSAGMMRRVANPVDYEQTRLLVASYLLYLRFFIGAAFVAVQAALLWRLLRRPAQLSSPSV